MMDTVENVSTNNKLQCTLALNSLTSVYDPEIGLSVVDLGLVYDIQFLEEEKKVKLQMTLTTQFCPMGESIVDNVSKAMEQTFPSWAVQVMLVFDPPWNFSRISEEGRQFLNK